MEQLPIILLVHVGLAYISLALLLTRGVMSARRVDWRQYKLLKIAPHAVDTFLLLSGILLAIIPVIGGFYTFADLSWLLPKLIFIALYIVFAVKAFKKTQPFSLKHFILAVVSFMASMAVAVGH